VLVALWCDGKLLLIQNTYKPYLNVPGGGVKAGESLVEAAARELAEEVGIRVPGDTLKFVAHFQRERDHIDDGGYVFECVLEVEPPVRVDRREVKCGAFLSVGAARQYPLAPVLERYLADREKRTAP